MKQTVMIGLSLRHEVALKLGALVVALGSLAGCSSSSPAKDGQGAGDQMGGPDGSTMSRDGSLSTTPDGGVLGGDAGVPTMGAGPVPPSSLATITLSGAVDAGSGAGSGSPCEISTATTWTAAVYVVRCNLQITAPLTIDQGTVIKFDQNASLTVGGQGSIQALGGSLYPIVFTSLKDDASGGDTNGDGTATSPGSGDWLGVEVANGFGVQIRSSTFQACRFYYAGQSDRSALASERSGTTSGVWTSVSVTGSVFAHNRTITDSLMAPPALDLRLAADGVVAGNLFYDNLVPLGVSSNVSVDDTNAFDNAAAAPDQPQANKYNGIMAAPSPGDTVDLAHSWSTTHVPFVGQGPMGGQLGPGVVLKFLPGSFWLATMGITTSVVFTSIADDSHGGDTNADGTATSPAPGDWGGVVVESVGTTVMGFDRCEFYYAGANTGQEVCGSCTPSAVGILEVGQGGISVTNSVFAHNRPAADSVNAGPALNMNPVSGETPTVIITGNTFYDNRVPLGISALVSLDDSNAFDNSTAAPSDPEPNDFNAIVLANQQVLKTASSWSETKVPLVLNSLSIASTGLLTLGNNVTLKFGKGSVVTVAQGGTLATGTGDVFTSLFDDSHGGDTNGDGAATSPSATDWGGIEEYGSCTTVSTEYYETCAP